MLPAGCPTSVVLDGDVRRLASLEHGPGRGREPPAGRVRILGQPHERARGVEAERAGACGCPGDPIGTGLSPSSLAQSGGSGVEGCMSRSVDRRARLADMLPHRPSPVAAPSAANVAGEK